MNNIQKVYGPYDKKDGRQIVVLKYEDGSRRTVSYPKYLMEQRLGRQLDPDKETVDHIDRDFTNNEWWNLRVIERSRHVKEDAKRRKPAKFTCSTCETVFEKNASYVYTNRKDGKAGPFCSRKCAGTYGMKVKKGEIEKEVVDFEEFEAENKEYYRPLKRIDGKGMVACKECLQEAGLPGFWDSDTAQDERCDSCGIVEPCVYVKAVQAIIYDDGEQLFIRIGSENYELAFGEPVETDENKATKVGYVEIDMNP